MLALSDSLTVPDWADTLPALKVEDVHGLSDPLIGESRGEAAPILDLDSEHWNSSQRLRSRRYALASNSNAPVSSLTTK